MAKRHQRKRRGFLIGAAVGAVAGLLLAPRAGKETRERLFGEQFDLDEQKNRWHEATDTSRDSAADSAQDLKKKIDETRERLRRQAGVDDE